MASHSFVSAHRGLRETNSSNATHKWCVHNRFRGADQDIPEGSAGGKTGMSSRNLPFLSAFVRWPQWGAGAWQRRLYGIGETSVVATTHTHHREISPRVGVDGPPVGVAIP